MSIIKIARSDFYYARFMVDGKIHQKSLKTTNKKLAEKLAQQYYEELLEKSLNPVPIKTISVEEAFKRYARTVVGKQNKPFEFYLRWLTEKQFLKSSDDISIISTEMLENIAIARREEGKKEGTVFQTVGFIKRAIDWATKNGYATSNVEAPAIKLKNSKLRWLTYEEEELLLEELNPNRRRFNGDSQIKQQYQDNYDLTILLLDTGARLNEVTSLKWSDIDLTKGTILLYRSKTSNEGLLYMTKRVKEVLKSRKQTGTYIFEDTEGGPKRAVRGIKNAMMRADLKDCSIHTLRHTCASRMVQNGVSLYEVSKMLGHANVNMTQRYAHLSSEEVSKRARDALEPKKNDQSDYSNSHIILKNDSFYSSSSSEGKSTSIYDDLLKPKSDKSTIQLS